MPKKTAKKVAKKTAKKTEKKAAPAKTKSDPASMQGWVDKMNAKKEFQGKAQISMASQVKTPYNLRRPTGILSLDLGLGGGLHAGGAVEIHGEESVGKTYLAYLACGMNQLIHGDESAILIFSTEIRPDKGFARKARFHIGYSPEEVAEMDLIRQSRGFPPFNAEEVEDLLSQTGTVIYLSSATADVGLDVIVEALRDGRFQLVVIESLGAFLTPAQAEEDVGKRHYAGASMLVTNFQNKVYPLFCMDRSDGSLLETTIIGINQARANMDAGQYGPKTKAAMGAYAWKHGQLASIMLSQGKRIKTEGEDDIGREVRWRLTKGKAGTHDGKTGVYDFYHVPRFDPVLWSTVMTKDVGGVDVNADLIDTGVSLGVLEQAGAWFSWPAREIKGQGAHNFAAKLEEQPELLDELREDCYRAAELMVRFR